MTTRDERTIADGAIEFWKVSGNDLFALATREGRILIVYTQGEFASAGLKDDLQELVTDSSKHYLFSQGRLFEFSARPLYFSDETQGTLLGYVVSGYAIDQKFVGQISQAAAADATFTAGDRMVVSTLDAKRQGILSCEAICLWLRDPGRSNSRSAAIGT